VLRAAVTVCSLREGLPSKDSSSFEERQKRTSFPPCAAAPDLCNLAPTPRLRTLRIRANGGGAAFLKENATICSGANMDRSTRPFLPPHQTPPAPSTPVAPREDAAASAEFPPETYSSSSRLERAVSASTRAPLGSLRDLGFQAADEGIATPHALLRELRLPELAPSRSAWRPAGLPGKVAPVTARSRSVQAARFTYLRAGAHGEFSVAAIGGCRVPLLNFLAPPAENPGLPCA